MTTTTHRSMKNRYAGKCQVCSKRVKEGEGIVVNDGPGGKWQTYCPVHSPVQKKAEVRRLTEDGYIEMPFERDALPLLRSIPGAWFDRNRSPVAWKVSLREGDRQRLLEVADQLKLDVPDSLRTVEVSEQAQNAHAAGLYNFQIDGVDWLAKGDKRLLADDMGLGKTVQVLAALPADAAALAVVPASVKYNWADEAAKWNPDLTPVVLEGRGSFRLPQPGELVITGFDTKGATCAKRGKDESKEDYEKRKQACANQAVLPGYLEPEKINANSKPWEVEVKWPVPAMAAQAANMVLIVDEAHTVKNYKTARAKRIKGLSLSAKKVWALTGTPLENRPPDLFGMLEALQMQHIVFGGWKRFVERMGGWKNRWGGYEWGTPDPIVPELMRRVMLRRIRTEVLPDLPSKTYTTMQVDVPAKLQAYMDTLWDEWEELLSADRMEDRELPPFEEFSKLRAQLAESRIPVLLEVAEEHEETDTPLVVFSSHLAPLNALAERDGWEKITGDTPARKRQEIVRRFQAGELKGVAASIRAAGIGLTLTRAWKMLFVDMDWVPGQNSQAEDRICRIGQTSNKVEIVRMVSGHTLDQHILDLIAWKIGIINAAINDRLTVNVERDNSEGETDEQFAQRMAEAAAVAAGLEADELAELTSDEWPAIEADPDLPF